jgi:hypothetical protein
LKNYKNKHLNALVTSKIINNATISFDFYGGTSIEENKRKNNTLKDILLNDTKIYKARLKLAKIFKLLKFEKYIFINKNKMH